MKKVSYTQMRAELSDILDALRNGEEVVVTQRGRPDTILSAQTCQAMNPKKDISSGRFLNVRGEHSPNKTGGWVQRSLAGSIVEVTKSTTRGMTFKEAMTKTKTKHSKIIKALGDK